MIAPVLMKRWLKPLLASKVPVGTLKQTFRRYVREDIGSEHSVLGCPLNNLAQEACEALCDYLNTLKAV